MKSKAGQDQLEEIEFLFPNMHVTRSSIQKGDLVPLHIHSNKYGFVYVLRGRCQITNYSIIRHEESSYLLKLISDQEYTNDQYTIVSRKNNVHSILALEDTTFLDIFTVDSSDETIQQFLKITNEVKNQDAFIAKSISISEANIPKHLLGKIFKRIEIND